MNEFTNELAKYCSVECNNCTYTLQHAKEMTTIAIRFNCQAELVYLMQFNYEDCTTVEEWQEQLQANLND